MTKTYVEFWSEDLAYLLYDCSRLLRRRFDEIICDFALRDAQWRVITLLSHSEGLKQTELAALLGIQKVPLGEHLDKLEAGGWIERRRDVSDRRANYVYINTNVKDQVDIIDQRFLDLINTLRTAMGADNWHVLQENLQKLFSGFAARNSQQALSHVKFSSNLYLIGVLSRQLSTQFDSALKQLGTTRSHWLVLSVVAHQPGISQRELARLLDMAKAPLGKVVEQLVNKHWLRREIDARDKRLKRLTVIKDAEETIEHAARDYRDLHKTLSDHLECSELQCLEKALQLLRSKLLLISRSPSSTASSSDKINHTKRRPL